MRRINLAGRTFGRWTVLAYDSNQKWICRCVCGNQTSVDGASLRHGRSKGCITCHTATGTRRTHGQSDTRIYRIWTGIIDRCENQNCDAFHRYGARGIVMCPEWRNSFTAFRDWALANGYDDKLTIDRRNNDAGYAPENCRWATYAEQNRNCSRNRPVEFRGQIVLICDLAVEVGLPQDILKNRVFRYGWSIEKAVSTPIYSRGKREPWKAMGISRSAWYRAGRPQA